MTTKPKGGGGKGHSGRNTKKRTFSCGLCDFRKLANYDSQDTPKMETVGC